MLLTKATSALYGGEKTKNEAGKERHPIIRAESHPYPHIWYHVTAHPQRSQQSDEHDTSDLLNSSKQDTNQAGHMLDNVCGNNFVKKGVEIWLVWFYIHLHKDGVISLDYVRITLI